jgi:hypothetical protein
VSTLWSLTVLFLIATVLLALSLYGLGHVKLLPLRLIVSTFAGFLTYFAIGAPISLAGQYSSSLWLFTYGSWIYFELFGLVPLVTRALFPDYSNEEGLFSGPIPTDQIMGERLSAAMVIGFWSLLFATVYFYRVRHRRPTI